MFYKYTQQKLLFLAADRQEVIPNKMQIKKQISNNLISAVKGVSAVLYRGVTAIIMFLSFILVGFITRCIVSHIKEKIKHLKKKTYKPEKKESDPLNGSFNGSIFID